MATKTRISVTLPPELVAAADERARLLDRSRSWVVAAALRRYVAAELPGGAQAGARRWAPGVPGAPRLVAEPAAPYVAGEVAQARRRHRRIEAALPAAERLRRAEELGRLARAGQGRGRRQQIVAFDSYEEYYAWKMARRIGA